MDCLFCKITGGDIPSYRVYEDGDVTAFLEIRPASAGHTLVVPKEHAETIYDLADEAYEKLMGVAKRIGQALQKLYEPRRVGLLVYGFHIAHAHVHLIPLHDGSEIELNHHETPREGEMQATAVKIKAAL